MKPLSATDPKRPEDNIVVGNWPATDTVGTLTADTHPGAYTGQDAHTGRLIAATLQGGGRRGYRIDAEAASGGHLVAHRERPHDGAG